MEVNAIFHSDDRRAADVTIQCKTDEKMSSIFQKFVSTISTDANVNDFEFYYLQNKIKGDSTIASLKKHSKTNDIIISFKKRSKVMRCPICVCNNAIIEIKDNKLNFYECCRGHERLDELFDNYNQTQNIPLENIKCHSCSKTQKDELKDFGKCLPCSRDFSKYFCPDCWEKHSKRHKVVKYDEKYYYCQKHYKKEDNVFNSYCDDCKKNLCKYCAEEEDKGHKVETFENMIKDIDIESMKGQLNIMKEKIEDLIMAVNDIKHYMDEGVKLFVKYYEISEDIIGKYESFNTELKNYQVLKTIKFLKISNGEMLQKLEKITSDDKSLEKKCSDLINIYKKDREAYSNNEQNNLKGTMIKNSSRVGLEKDEDEENPNPAPNTINPNSRSIKNGPK